MINQEEIIEEGVVISSDNGTAEISLLQKDTCEECFAKILCKPIGDDKRTIQVTDPFNVLPGDFVRISIKGSLLLRVSFTIYGLPVLLFLIGLVLPNILFDNLPNKELISFLSGFILLIIYFIVLFLRSRTYKILTQPKIISVSRMRN